MFAFLGLVHEKCEPFVLVKSNTIFLSVVFLNFYGICFRNTLTTAEVNIKDSCI